MKQSLTEKIKYNLNLGGIQKALFKIPYLFATKSFKFFERYFKLHITPVHYYSPIPDTSSLGPEVYNRVYDCQGIDFDDKEYLNFLNHVAPKYLNEYTPEFNTGLSLVDSFVLYSLIRENKPKTMIEIGGGSSTLISLKALNMNLDNGNPFKFYTIEPYPIKPLRDLKDDNFELIDKKLQDIDIDFLTQADFLFIDSSHISRINSDVNYEILEIIPKLKTGTIIHWHDIMIPTDYWKEWIDHGNMFFNESYMLHAFLLYNNSFQVVWPSRYMQLNYPGPLKNSFSFFSPDDMAQQMISFWIQRVK